MTDLLNSRYHLLEVLGQGSMGVVWRALDTVLDREVAIKELRPGQGVDPAEARDRFLVEARAAAKLSHPNIVAVHDVFSDGDRVLITMELVAGPTLAQVVSGSGPQSAEVVRAVMAQVAQALAGAHGAGVVHRDLKPENIFWTPQGRAVVADFGLARIGAGRGTMEGTVMGTPGYMAPEQVRGIVVGPAADVFAWGAVAFELATGQAPFGEATATDPSALAYRIVHQDPPPLDMPTDPALAELITRAMAKDPDERPPDGAALVDGMGGRQDRTLTGSEPVQAERAFDETSEATTGATSTLSRRGPPPPAPKRDDAVVRLSEPTIRARRAAIVVGGLVATMAVVMMLVLAARGDPDELSTTGISLASPSTTGIPTPGPTTEPTTTLVAGDAFTTPDIVPSDTTVVTTTTMAAPVTTTAPPRDPTTTSITTTSITTTTTTTTTVPPPTERELGGLPALTAYCQALGYDDWTFAKATSGPQTAYDNWSCHKQRPMDMTAACRHQYSRSDATAYARDGNDAYSWRCTAPPPPGYAQCAAVGCGDIGDLPNLRSYCKATGLDEDRLVKPASGSNAAYDNWHCYRRVLMSMDDACRKQYGRSDAFARPTNPDNPATWRCYVRS